MPNASDGHGEILSALDQLLAKYFEEKDESTKEKTSIDKFWGTYARATKGEDEARPRDWDGNTGSILTFVRQTALAVCFRLIAWPLDWSIRCYRRGLCH